MVKITKKLKRSIVMLLMSALVTSSIPMNTNAVENDNYDVTYVGDSVSGGEIQDVSENEVNCVMSGQTKVLDANKAKVDIPEEPISESRLLSVSFNCTGKNADIINEKEHLNVKFNVKEVAYHTVTISQNIVSGNEVVGVVYDNSCNVRGHEGNNYLPVGNDLIITFANVDVTKYTFNVVKITVNDVELSNKDYKVEDSTYIIEGNVIIGDIVFHIDSALK